MKFVDLDGAPTEEDLTGGAQPEQGPGVDQDALVVEGEPIGTESALGDGSEPTPVAAEPMGGDDSAGHDESA